MNMNENKKAIAGVILVVAVIGAYMLGRSSAGNSYAGTSTPGVAASMTSTPSTDSTAISDAQFAPFWKVWHLLDQKYVAATSTTAQDKVWGAIKGLASSEGDPYTVFFPPSESKMFQSDIAGNFEGVGMEIDVKNNALTVVAPLKGSPAEKAGMKTGDIILKINGKDTSDLSVDKAVDLIRGPKGTIVKLNVFRQGTQGTSGSSTPFDVNITRDVINVPTLETSIKGSGPNEIFVITLYSFTADSANLFRNALRAFVQSGSHKLVLDLRGNPGGYLDAAWDMASWFLPAGSVVVTEDFGAKAPPQIYRSKGYNIFNKSLDMYILVNGGSASAAEILAGALREQGVAQLVGTKTFGKGSVQELVPITPDTSLKVTVARWLTPKGFNLSHDGLDPDYIVTTTDKDVASQVDPQMNKAVQLLNAKP
jgi:carboxyl-terminal processing protease